MNDNDIPTRKITQVYNALVPPENKVRRLSSKRIEDLHLRQHVKHILDDISSVRTLRSGRKRKLSRTARIKVVAKENPKRPGTARYGIFDLYRDGMSIEELLRASNDHRTTLRALRHDLADGHIKIVRTR